MSPDHCHSDPGPRNSSGITLCIKGAGEMATGIAWCLYQAGFRKIVMVETHHPLAVRRQVSFCEAVHQGEQQVEGVMAVRADNMDEVKHAFHREQIPVIPDPEWKSISQIKPHVVVDALIAKQNRGTHRDEAPLVLGLGPGFTPGKDVDQVIETHRGHNLGRILDQGTALANTGIPGDIGGYTRERVLRAPCGGQFISELDIGTRVEAGTVVGRINGQWIKAGISGVLRGQIRPGTRVRQGMKIGDIDPRGILEYCHTLSDKARTLGGSVLQAILAWQNQHRVDLVQALGLTPPGALVSIIGAGGKTSLMFALAHTLAKRGYNVLTTTSTKIFVPGTHQSPNLILTPDIKAFKTRMARLHSHPTHVTAGMGIDKKRGKLLGFTPEFLDKIHQLNRFDYIFVEADGSRQKPVKASADHEPVLPAATTHLFHVSGLDALGCPLTSDHVHRPELMAKLLGFEPGRTLDPKSMARIIEREMGKALTRISPVECRVLLNKADRLENPAHAQSVARRLKALPADCLVTRLNAPNPVVNIHGKHRGNSPP